MKREYELQQRLQNIRQVVYSAIFPINDEDAPISIITTLAALSYRGETDLYEALCNILDKMPEYIEYRNGVYWVENPVMREENFADKWNQKSSKKDAFYNWVAQARRDIIEIPLKCFGIDEIAKLLGERLGNAPVNRAAKEMGNQARSTRQAGGLFVKGLTGGLSTTTSVGSKVVKEHTFFGK